MRRELVGEFDVALRFHQGIVARSFFGPGWFRIGTAWHRLKPTWHVVTELARQCIENVGFKTEPVTLKSVQSSQLALLMSDQNYCGTERRSNDPTWSAFTAQLAALHNDVGDIKAGMQDFRDGMKELAAAILKLALVEERQAQASQAIERCFKLAEKLDQKVETVAARVTELEKSEPGQNRAAEWVDRAVWAAASAAVMMVAAKAGLL